MMATVFGQARVVVSLVHPHGVHPSHSGLVMLPALASLSDPGELFKSILGHQAFAPGIRFSDFDVCLSGDVTALYKRDRFAQLWRIAEARLGLVYPAFSVGDQVVVISQATLNRGRSGVVEEVRAGVDTLYAIHLHGSGGKFTFSGSEIELDGNAVRTSAATPQRTERAHQPEAVAEQVA